LDTCEFFAYVFEVHIYQKHHVTWLALKTDKLWLQ